VTWLGAYCVALLLAGLALARGLRGGRAPAALLTLAAVALLGRAGQTLLQAPNSDWAGARLMPLWVWLQDGGLYQGPDRGVVYNTIYAPLSYLVYSPVLLCVDSLAAVLTASAIGLVWYFAPVALAAGGQARGRLGWTAALAGVAGFGLVSYRSRALGMSIEGTIHDCPALGLGALAVLLLARDRGAGARGLAAPALLAVLAVWSKQVMAPLAVVLPVWALLAHGPRRALACLGWLLAWAVASVAVAALCLDREALWFNVIVLPARHPWCAPFPRCVLSVVYHGYRELWLAAAAVSLLVLLERPHRDPGRHPWFLFVLAGLAQLPTAFLARVKLGGSSNSFSPPLYFFLLAVLVYLLEFLRDPARAAAVARAVRVGLAVGMAGLAGLQVGESADFLKGYAGPGRSKERLVTAYLRGHPGEAWFPWNPLPHALVEGRACHFAYGLFDRELGGFPIHDHHLLQYVPPGCVRVCFPPGRRAHRPIACLERLLRDFPRRVAIDGLPEFECYERASASPRHGRQWVFRDHPGP
jgi:hypothetical protein